MRSGSDVLETIAGLLIVAVCHILYAVGMIFLSHYLPLMDAIAAWINFQSSHFWLYFISYSIVLTGVVQIVYVWPIYRYFMRKGKRVRAKAVQFAAVATLLMSGPCFVVLSVDFP